MDPPALELPNSPDPDQALEYRFQDSVNRLLDGLGSEAPLDTLVGDFLGEADLIAIAYVFEQGAQGHVEPDVVATFAEIESVLSGDEASN